jgi:chemotaxis signal transduction protein
MTAHQSIPLLRFCVGSMHFAIAAEDVVAVVPAHHSAVHIGTILGLDPAASDRRVIHLAPRSEDESDPPLVAFQADSPVDVIRCSTEDLMSVPAAIPPEQWKPVIGFAHISERLILLLDIPSVIAKLMENRRGRPL